MFDSIFQVERERERVGWVGNREKSRGGKIGGERLGTGQEITVPAADRARNPSGSDTKGRGSLCGAWSRQFRTRGDWIPFFAV